MTTRSVRVVLKPPGRGRWAPLVCTFTGKHSVVLGNMLGGWPIGFRRGQRIELGGVQWRVCSVQENPVP